MFNPDERHGQMKNKVLWLQTIFSSLALIISIIVLLMK